MIPKIIEYTVVLAVVFLMLRLPGKKRSKIMLILTFLLSVFIFTIWFNQQKVPHQQKLVSVRGKIVEAYYGKGKTTRDIIFRLDKLSTKFLYLAYFPDYREVDTQIRIDNVLTVWYDQSQTKSYYVWRIDNEQKTLASFSEIAESYESNSKLGLYIGIFFACCFIGFLTKELYRHKHVAT